MIELGFGKSTVKFDPKGSGVLAVLEPNEVRVLRTESEEVEYALAHPIGSDTLEKLARGKKNAVIITSDITRPMPSAKVLPAVVARLKDAGIKDADITVVFGLGSHRPHTEEEKKYLVGEEIYRRVKTVDSDKNDVVNLGTTSRGTPVKIFRTVAEADFVVCLGNIEYHYFAGYSGGAKAVMPGVSTPEAIQVNHKMMTEPDSYAGNHDSPVRLDIEESVKFQHVDFILNVVLDAHKKIIKAVAGDCTAAHREGCDFLDSLYKIEIKEKADIVVVSAGGFPKDINMYQAQKALDNAKHAVREGGIIVWLAACGEGLENPLFEKWMSTCSDDEMIGKIKEDFKLGAHKAAAIALVRKMSNVYLVSELGDDFVRSLGFMPFGSLDEAFAAAKKKLGENASLIVMPYGGSTLPKFSGK